jgi:glycine/D-amino acid oxidase-like deaminating enzyme
MGERVDILIVGQGLAGTTLAWRLLRRGASVLVVERDSGPGASRVAAGLLAPVGGKRLAPAWGAHEAWPAALSFYGGVEHELGAKLLDVRPVVRLFVDEEQRRQYRKRAAGGLAPWNESDSAAVCGADFVECLGGFQAVGARLDVTAYLAASRAEFQRRGMFYLADLSLSDDLEVQHDGVSIKPLGVRADRVVLCRGWSEATSGNPAGLSFEPAKGEVLTVHVPGLSERRTVQRGVWLAPLGESLYRVGATFDRQCLDEQPTAEGREELLGKLRQFLRRPFEVVEHQAGVRPIIQGRRPVASELPGQPRVGVFNGLGASGTLWAPWIAEGYAERLTRGQA